MSEQHWKFVDAAVTVVSDTPQELWQNACKYFQWCDEHPIIVKRKILSGNRAGTDTEVEQVRPYSLRALCLHCGITEEYMKNMRDTKDRTSMYFIVASKILYVIWVQIYEMGMIGEFNAIFAGKSLGFDKPEEAPVSSIKIEFVQGIPELADSENEILEKLETENKLWNADNL